MSGQPLLKWASRLPESERLTEMGCRWPEFERLGESLPGGLRRRVKSRENRPPWSRRPIRASGRTTDARCAGSV